MAYPKGGDGPVCKESQRPDEPFLSWKCFNAFIMGGLCLSDTPSDRYIYDVFELHTYDQLRGALA